jgi:hypothetical protein
MAVADDDIETSVLECEPFGQIVVNFPSSFSTQRTALKLNQSAHRPCSRALPV